MEVDTVKSSVMSASKEQTMDEEQPKLHPLTELMLARMDSHPEEFPDATQHGIISAPGRWYRAISAIFEFGAEADKAALLARRNELAMQRAHEWAIDELLNGEERRNKAKEHEENLMQQATNLQRQVAVQAGGLLSGVGGVSGAGGSGWATAQGVQTIGNLAWSTITNAQWDPAADMLTLRTTTGDIVMQVGNKKQKKSLADYIRGMLGK